MKKLSNSRSFEKLEKNRSATNLFTKFYFNPLIPPFTTNSPNDKISSNLLILERLRFACLKAQTNASTKFCFCFNELLLD